ncbi:MAG TPA: 4Fe-4S ferredoxin, partial [Ruminococcaceae bacterium]|nr:4Fe-4S ferredoxin [Oscillospiraceae bacterium]
PWIRCDAACPFGAIHVGEPITNFPVLSAEKCKGCGACVAKCPGMAIFVIDKSYSQTKGSVSFPYEYYPLPEVGSTVTVVNRQGEAVGNGKVLRVQNPVSFDHTPVVTVEVDLKLINEVRSMERRHS